MSTRGFDKIVNWICSENVNTWWNEIKYSFLQSYCTDSCGRLIRNFFCSSHIFCLDLQIMYIYIQGVYIYTYTGCPRRNLPDFGRVFLMLKYTDITQNNYVQSWTVTEIMDREKCGLLAGPRTVPVSWQALSMFVLECGVRWRKVNSHYPYSYVVGLYQNAQSAMLRQCLPFMCHV